MASTVTGLKTRGRRMVGRQAAKFMDELAADVFIRMKERARHNHAVVDYDPLLAVMDMGLDRTTDPDLKARCHMYLAKFFYAEKQVVAVNVTHEDESVKDAATPEQVADAILGRMEQVARERHAQPAEQPKQLAKANGKGNGRG